VKGVVYIILEYMQTVFTHFGGWHSGVTGDDGFLSHVCHSWDGESHTGWGERFEHPTKTWACATHKQFTMQMVAVAIVKATEVRVGNERGVGGKARRAGRRG
jgi:hypothetical protein